MKSKSIQTSLLHLSLFVWAIISLALLSANESIKTIEGSIPAGWELNEIKKNEIPWGHYWGLNYDGPKGHLIVLQGPADVNFNWQDRNGNWHEIPLAKEILEIWVMPTGYHDSWKRFFNLHRPIPAKHIFSCERGEIFVHPTHRITLEKRFKELLSQAKTTSWPDSPGNEGKLSWLTWEADLKQMLKAKL